MSNGDPIKPDSAQNQGNSTANPVDGGKVVNPLPRAGDVAINQANQPDTKAGETDKPAQPSQQDILDRIRAGELWMIVFTAVVALTTVAQFIQSGCNNASTSKQVDRIIGATNTQACAAQQIAEASKRNATAAESFSLSASNIRKDTKLASEQLKRSARDSEEALHIAERPYITWSSPDLHIARKMLTLPITSTGRLPSGKVTAIIYEETMNIAPGEVGEQVRGVSLERHKSIITITSISPGTPSTNILQIPVPYVDLARLQNNAQKIQVVGTLTYSAGFPGLPIQEVPVCIQNIFNDVAKEALLVTCDATNILPGYEAKDWSGPGMTSTINQ